MEPVVASRQTVGFSVYWRIVESGAFLYGLLVRLCIYSILMPFCSFSYIDMYLSAQVPITKTDVSVS